MKNKLIKQLLEWILPLIKDNILKFEKQLYNQMQEIPLQHGENNVVFMIYAADGSLKGSLGVLETATTDEGSEILKLGRPIAIQGQEEINFSELLMQFSQLDNHLIISEAGNTLSEKNNQN